MADIKYSCVSDTVCLLFIKFDVTTTEGQLTLFARRFDGTSLLVFTLF